MKKWTLFFGFCVLIIGLQAQAPCITGTLSADQTTICTGNSVNLSIDDFEDGVSFQWQVSTDNTEFDDILNATGESFDSESLTNTTYYRVMVSAGTNNCTTAYSDTITIMVDEPQTPPEAIVGTTTICEDTSTELKATGDSGDVFEWGTGSTIGDNIIPNAVGKIYNTVNLTESTTYWVRRQANSCGPATSGLTQLVTVQKKPTAPESISADPNPICSGSSTMLVATGGDNGTGAVFEWGKGSINDNPPISTTTSNSLDIENLTATTTYWVRRKGNTSCTNVTDAVTIEVIVHDPPEAPTNILVGGETVSDGDTIVCKGTSVILTADGGEPGTTSKYEWGTGTVGNNIINGATTSSYTSSALTSNTQFWVRRIGTSACTGITNAAAVQIQVLPEPSVAVGTIVELCQLTGQSVLIENTTAPHSLTPSINVNWQLSPGAPGEIQELSQNASYELFLDLENAPTNLSFQITQVSFESFPHCLVTTGLPTETFSVKVRPSTQIASIQDEDLTGNGLCQDYGPVNVSIATLPANENIVWEASYQNPTTTVDVSNTTSFDLNNLIVGNHVVIIDSIAYSDGLPCKFNPADFGIQYSYSDSVTIKPTPPAVEFVDGAPSILQFCDYAAPLVLDSVAKVDNLNTWVDNEDGYTIKWKSSNDNAAADLNNIALVSGGGYYPVFELGGCHSKLNTNSLPLIVDLMPLPGLPQSNLVFPTSICSGTPFDILFNPGENISHFVILDSDFDAPLSSPNISDASSYPNIAGSNFSIINSSATADTWIANIYAQNKNVSVVNPVTCWAEPIPIEITVNPNATFNPATTSFESCQNGSDFTIDPKWNGIGEVEWDDPLGLPASISIDGDKIITVDMSAQTVPPGVYPIHISGGYPDSNCQVDATFTVSIYATPEVETHILDIDNTICHNEFTHIEVIDPQADYTYQWSCTGCETNPGEGSYFLPHWSNPKPSHGTWTDRTARYSVTAIDISTNCENSKNINVNIRADYASCPEGIDFFLPNGLSVVDGPALYFQWYDVESAGVFSAIPGATDQTYFPSDDIEGCDTSRYIVATSLYADRCWSTTVNCFEEFGTRTCDGPKSKSNSPKFSVYPNPVVGNDVILENLSKDLEGRYSIELIDIAGKVLMSDIIEIEMIGQKRIRLPEVDQGVYLLRVSNTRHNETFKIIIN